MSVCSFRRNLPARHPLVGERSPFRRSAFPCSPASSQAESCSACSASLRTGTAQALGRAPKWRQGNAKTNQAVGRRRVGGRRHRTRGGHGHHGVRRNERPAEGSHAGGVRHRRRRVQHDRVRDGRLLGRLQQDGQDPQCEQPVLLQLRRAAQGQERPRQLPHQDQGGLRDHQPAERLGRGCRGAGHRPEDQVQGRLVPVHRLRPFLRRPQADLPGRQARWRRLRGVRQGRDHLGGPFGGQGRHRRPRVA